MEQANPLGRENIPRLLLKYAIPSVVSMLVMSLYNIVDQIFIGRGVGYLGNSATTVAFPLVTAALAISLLTGNGAAAFISLELGKGDHDKARRAFGNALAMLVVLSCALAAVSLVFLEPVLRFLGATDAVMPYAVEYTSVIAAGFPFAMIGTAVSNMIRADGSPTYSMVSVLTGAALNTVLDPIFIFRFGMGVRGAAIATVLSQAVSFAIVLYYAMFRGRIVRFGRDTMRLSGSVMRRVAGLGSASFVTQMGFFVVNILLNNSLTYYGGLSEFGSEIPLAALGIVQKISAIFISLILGIAIGAQPILGYNYGAGNFARVKRTYFTEIAITGTLSAVANLLFVFAPRIFVAMIGDPDPQFNSFAVMGLRIFLCCVFAAGIQIPSASYFQAVGKPLKSMVLSMSRQIISLVPAVLILPLLFGLNGILYAGPTADLLALCVTTFFIPRELRQLSKN